MIEVFVFNPDCRYGMGMMSGLMSEIVQHHHIRFMSVIVKDKPYVVIALSTSMSCKEYSDDEGIEIHLMI